MLLRQVEATAQSLRGVAFQDGEVAMKSTPVIVALAAVTLSSLALIQSAEARRYRSVCGFPEYGYLAPYTFGGNNTPRVSFCSRRGLLHRSPLCRLEALQYKQLLVNSVGFTWQTLSLSRSRQCPLSGVKLSGMSAYDPKRKSGTAICQ